MIKEEFLKKKVDIKEKMLALRDEEKSLQEEYLKSIAEFKKGDRVTVEDNKGVLVDAFVNDYDLDYGGNIKYIINKMKKDGTMSSLEYPWYNYKKETIKKVD